MSRSTKESKKIKWLVYTVIVGLIPVISRFVAWLVTKHGTVSLIAASDFISFGLVLHISNINEIEHIENDRNWKTIHNGTSILFISLYALLFSLNLIGESISVVNQSMINACSIVLVVISILISYSVYYRISMHSKFSKNKLRVIL